jgi:hypothetical protein
LSGTIANILGAKGRVEKITKHYQEGYRERLEKSREAESSPSSPILN